MIPVDTLRHDHPVGTFAVYALLSIAVPEHVTVNAAVLVEVALAVDPVAVGALLAFEPVGTAPLALFR
jgi:hypothetical protein